MKTTTIQHKLPLDQLAPAGRIGVISLATDINIETDLNNLFPDDISFFTSRIRNYNPLTIENLRRMEPGLSTTAETLVPGLELDAIIYACTSGTVAIGEPRITELIRQSHPNAPITNPIRATLSAFRKFSAKNISILTPYTESVNRDIGKFYSNQGFNVLNIAGFGFEDDTAMTFISPQDIQDAAIECCDPNADLMFISCTALRATAVLDEVEKILARPVISSNQALVWHTLRLTNYPSNLTTSGTLLRKHITPQNAE